MAHVNPMLKQQFQQNKEAPKTGIDFDNTLQHCNIETGVQIQHPMMIWLIPTLINSSVIFSHNKERRITYQENAGDQI